MKTACPHRRRLTGFWRLLAAMITFIAFGQSVTKAQQSEDTIRSLKAQADRARVIYERGRTPHYTQKFDLSGLPRYEPKKLLNGWLRIHGSNYLSDGALGEYWQQAFAKFQPGIRISYYLPTSAIAFAALYYDQADLAIGHSPGFYDLLAYQRIKNSVPVEISAFTGSYDVAGWENSTVILVNEQNPIEGLTMQQLDGIFGAARDGGWAGTNFRPDWARGPEGNIRTWREVGLTGEWADKPINVYGFNLRYNTAADFADKVLKGSDKWNENIHAYAHIVRDDGTRYIQADQITDALANDRYGIAFNRYRGERPGVKRIALAAAPDGPFVPHTIENIQNRSYPIINEQFFYFHGAQGTAAAPLIQEFLRFVLSRDGQAEVQRDGKYLPLTAEVVKEQLKKLDQLLESE